MKLIVPTLTFCSTASVVAHLGARPVLVNVGEDFNVTPQVIESAITSRTKAIVPVHFAGQACDLDSPCVWSRGNTAESGGELTDISPLFS